VDVFADEGPSSEGQFGAAVLFVRWSETGSHPIGHLETPYLVFGATADEAVAAIRRLTLRQLKGYLDALVADQQQGPLR
jgi:hypothetical protein